MSDSFITTDYSTSYLCHITIDRLAAKNALTSVMYLELADLLEQCDIDENIRVVLISGNEEVFCAGNDLSDFMHNKPQDTQAPPFKFLLALNQFSKPLIAATAGPAIGIGTTMLLHCDHVVSANNTLFKMPFVQLGLTPEGGSSLLLNNLIGHRQASELLMLGASFDSERAFAMKLINQVCDPDELFDKALKICQQYSSQAPKALQAAKTLMKAPFIKQIEQVILDEGKVFIERLHDNEVKEALIAIKEKRAPKF
mgnify:CR=1 FL=1